MGKWEIPRKTIGKSWENGKNHGKTHGKMMGYPLVNVDYNHGLISTLFFTGKIHYKWAVFHSCVDLPEGTFIFCCSKKTQKQHVGPNKISIFGWALSGV